MLTIRPSGSCTTLKCERGTFIGVDQSQPPLFSWKVSVERVAGPRRKPAGLETSLPGSSSVLGWLEPPSTITVPEPLSESSGSRTPELQVRSRCMSGAFVTVVSYDDGCVKNHEY